MLIQLVTDLNDPYSDFCCKIYRGKKVEIQLKKKSKKLNLKSYKNVNDVILQTYILCYERPKIFITIVEHKRSPSTISNNDKYWGGKKDNYSL